MLRLAEIDCSSPMSAKSDLNTGMRDPTSTGMCRPDCAIAASSPAVFRATVFPPVFGPVITRMRVGGVRRMSTGTGSGVRDSGFGVRVSSFALGFRIPSPESRIPIREPLDHGAHEKRMSRTLQFERSVSRDDRFHRAGHQREACAGLDDVERCRDFNRAFEFIGTCAESVGERQQNAQDLLHLLLFERDDVVVDLDGLEWFDEQAGAAGRAAVDDARDRRSMLGADHQHVTAVAIGDDLFLEILRCLAAAQKRIERRSQALFLPAQAVANLRERRARVVGDVTGWFDLAANVGNLAGERCHRIDLLAENRKRRAHPPDRLT